MDQKVIQELELGLHNSTVAGVGVDIVNFKRVQKFMAYSKDVLGYVFTKIELDCFYENKDIHKASLIFGAKEAISKAIGTGFSEFNFRDIEVMLSEDSDIVEVDFKNKALDLVKKLNINDWKFKKINFEEYLLVMAVAVSA